MEFWGVEVKVGETVKVDPVKYEACIHVSQAALGEAKKDKTNEAVVLYLKVDNQKFVLGTLSRENIPQISFELVLEKEFELSHSSKNASVYFCGFKGLISEYPPSGFSDSDEEDLALMNAVNGKSETKAEKAKVSESQKTAAKASASEKQVKVVDPKKDEEEESDADDDDEFESSDDEMDADSDGDEESDGDEDDEETPPKKADLGKKRPDNSASKTPVPTKKAKIVTPEKTDGKKSGHVATPHPMKKGGKTPKSEAKDQTPKSGGQFCCKSCSKTFNSEGGLQQHNKAKHGGQ